MYVKICNLIKDKMVNIRQSFLKNLFQRGGESSTLLVFPKKKMVS